MVSSSTRQRHPKPHCFMCDSILSGGSSSSAASTRQRQRQWRSGTIHESTATSVPSSTSTISSSTRASAISSSTSSRSTSLRSHSTSSVRQQWQQRRSAMVLVPTPLPSSSSTAPPPRAPSTLRSSTMTSAAAGSSMSSPLSILASGPSLAPSATVSLSHAVSVELAFAGAPSLVKRVPSFVKRVLGRWEEPPWFWGQKNSGAWLTVITREDVEEENNVCAICMEEYRDLQPCYIVLRCFHFFHKYCLLEWGVHCFLQGKDMNCPFCRSKIPMSPISLLHEAFEDA